MEVLKVNNIAFKRRLKPAEETEFKQTLEHGKLAIGNVGNSTLIVPSTALSQNINKNTGVGNLASKESREFFDFAKQYWGINTVQLIADGEYSQRKKGEFKPYSGTSLSLGTHLIEPELLTTKEFANLLTKEDFEEILKSNTSTNKDIRVNYENILDKDSITDKKLKKAFNELLKSDTEEKKQMLKEIEEFSLKNNDWLESKSIFEILKEKYKTSNVYSWESIDRDLYNPDFVNNEQRINRIKELKKLNNAGKFFEFKQYLAESHLNSAKTQLNSKGIKLNGDMIIGFSFDEQWAHPKAFHQGKSIGWGLPALNLDSSEAENLVRKKTGIYAKRYDGIRVDAGWAYIKQPDNPTFYGEKFLNIIEDEVKKVKGSDFNLENINYEFIGSNISPNEPSLRNRTKIHCTNHNIEQYAYSSKDIIGATNHDCQPMKLQYKEYSARELQTRQLADILKIPKEKVETLNEFIKAKFAHAYDNKNNMLFYIDTLALDKSYQENINPIEDYRVKIPNSYQDDYFKLLEKGEGFNVMDSLEKIFKTKGLDKKEPELYKKIVKFRNILEGKEVHSNKKLLLIASGISLAGALIYFGIKRGLPDSNSQDV